MRERGVQIGWVELYHLDHSAPRILSLKRQSHDLVLVVHLSDPSILYSMMNSLKSLDSIDVQ